MRLRGGLYITETIPHARLLLPAEKVKACIIFPAMAIVARTFDSLHSYLGSFTWGPFVNLSRSTVLGLLSRIEVGQLVVRDSDGTVTICGQPGSKDASPRTELRVSKEAFWVRVMLFADMVGDLIFAMSAGLGVRASRPVWELRF